MITHDLVKQKYIEDSLIDILTPYDLGPSVIFIWKDGLIFEATVQAISECDNDKELNDPDFMEFMAAFILVSKVIECKNPEITREKKLGPPIYPGIGYVIHFNNAPDLILDGDTVIWKKPEIPNHAQSDICSS